MKSKLGPYARVRKEDRATQRQLLEEAGQVFAEVGFDRATGKEICRRAGANSAAINYYFGSMSGIYAAVLQEAFNRLVTLDALSAAVAGKPDPKAKLRAVLEIFARAVTGPLVSSWVLRVLGRELLSPSAIFAAIDAKVRLPKVRIMKGIVGEILGLSEDDPIVARCCISIMAPCIMLLIADRSAMRRTFPGMGLSGNDAEVVAEHLVKFALAGLGAISGSKKR